MNMSQRHRKQSHRLPKKITEEGLDHVVSLIRESKKPYIFVGGGSIISGAAEEVRELHTIYRRRSAIP